jgi:hypothetical protein
LRKVPSPNQRLSVLAQTDRKDAVKGSAVPLLLSISSMPVASLQHGRIRPDSFACPPSSKCRSNASPVPEFAISRGYHVDQKRRFLLVSPLRLKANVARSCSRLASVSIPVGRLTIVRWSSRCFTVGKGGGRDAPPPKWHIAESRPNGWTRSLISWQFGTPSSCIC